MVSQKKKKKSSQTNLHFANGKHVWPEWVIAGNVKRELSIPIYNLAKHIILALQ